MLLFISALTAFAGLDRAEPIAIDARDGTSLHELQELAAQAGITNVHWVDSSVESEALAVGDATDVDAAVLALSQSSLIEVAEPDGIVTTAGSLISTLTGKPNDADYSKQWHMRDSSIDAEWVWSHTSAGKGIIVSVLDTGFTLTSDFDPVHVLPGKSFVGDGRVDDYHGHGTHCAATIAEWTNNGIGVTGLANQVMILPGKVLSDSGSGSMTGIAAGIDWATDQGADVISMSLGGAGHSGIIENAVKRAISKGVVVVAAAGNESSSRFGSPGDIPELTTVGAIGPKGDRSYYSNYGPRVDFFAPGGDKNFPGGGVFQMTSVRGVEQLAEWQGTSMATPHVAAATAVLLGEGVCPKNAERQKCVDTIWAATATPKAGKGDREYGLGILNLRKALETSDPTPPGGCTRAQDFTVSGGSSLPYSNPAGSLTYVVTALSVVLLWILRRQYSLSNAFYSVAGVTALGSAGGLYAATYIPLNLHALALFMVPWLEFPEYVFGTGMSGFPLWLSFLPMVIPFVVLTPIRFLRPVIVGLLASSTSYLLLDTFLGFNQPWFMNAFGSAIWLGTSGLISLAFLVMALHWEEKRNEI